MFSQRISLGSFPCEGPPAAAILLKDLRRHNASHNGRLMSGTLLVLIFVDECGTVGIKRTAGPLTNCFLPAEMPV